MGLELLGTGAGAAQGLEQLLTQRRAEELMRQQALMHAMSAIGLRDDRQARLEQQKSQADALAESRSQSNNTRLAALNLQKLQALGPGTTLGKESFASLTNPETGAALPEQFDESKGTAASLPSASLSGFQAIAGGPSAMQTKPEASQAINSSYRFKGTAQQQSGEVEADRKREMADAAISARIQGLNQAAERLKMQGQMNEANILLAQARAEAANAKAEKDRGANGPSPYAAERTRRAVESARSLKEQVGNLNTGPGSMLANIPGTGARNFRAQLDTLKGNIGFGELQAMREASKSGGALGQVSDRELTLLSSVLGSLDAGQSPSALRGQLQQIEDSLTRWQNAQGGGAIKPAASHETSKPTADELIKKYGGG